MSPQLIDYRISAGASTSFQYKRRRVVANVARPAVLDFIGMYHVLILLMCGISIWRSLSRDHGVVLKRGLGIEEINVIIFRFERRRTCRKNNVG